MESWELIMYKKYIGLIIMWTSAMMGIDFTISGLSWPKNYPITSIVLLALIILQVINVYVFHIKKS